MEKNRLTLAFCLRSIAENLEKYNFWGMKIGASCLTFETDGYDVVDWQGNKTHHVDLADAIGKFIEVQPNGVH